MSNYGGVRNIERLKRALQQLQKLTPQDIQKLNKQQSIHELRLKRLAFHQPRQQVAPPPPSEPSQQNQQSQYNPNEMSEVRNSNAEASSNEVVRVQGIRWSIFNQDSIAPASKHNPKEAPNYQGLIDQKIQEWRKIYRQEGLSTSAESPQQRQAFSSVFSNQIGPNKQSGQSQPQQGLVFPRFPNQILNNINKNTNSSTNPVIDLSKIRGSIFSGNSKELKDLNQQNIQSNDPKNSLNINLGGQNKKQQNISHVNNTNMGFVPGLFTTSNKSSIFDRKLQTPQVLPPQPINTNKSLFSQFNPLSAIKVQSKPIFNNNTNASSSNQSTQNLFNNSLNKASDDKPKINIFAKTLNQVEIEAPRPLDSKSGLFSSHNPIAELGNLKQNQPKKDQQSTNLFSNNIFTQNLSNEQKIHPKNIFSSSNDAAKQTPTQNTQKPQSFLTGGLFGKKQQGKVNIFDNSLFGNSTKPNINTQVQSQNTPKFQQKQTKPQILSNPFSHQQAQKPETKRENQQQKPSLFSFAKNINQSKPSSNILGTGNNIFQAPKNKSNEQRFQKPTNLFAPKQQPKQPATSLFGQSSSQSERTNTNFLSNSNSGSIDKPKNNIFISTTPAPPLFLNTAPTPEGNQKQKKATPNIFGSIGLPLTKVQNSEKVEQKSIFEHKGPPLNIFNKPQHQNKQSLFGGANPPKMNIFSLDKKQQVKNQNSQQSQQKAPSSVKKKPNQLFGDFIKSKPDNMFSSKDPKASTEGGLFPKSSEPANIFTAAAKTNTLFGKSSNPANIFLGSTNSIFATNAPNKKQDQDEDVDQEGDDDQVIEDKQEIDPSKSNGNFKYEQSTIIYRQNVPKFKKGTQNILENVILSIQKFAGLQNCTLAVRLANKCLYFSGTIQPKFAEISKIKQNQFRNLSIKKIMTIQDGKPTLQLLKIQFKDEKQGELFYNKFCQANKK